MKTTRLAILLLTLLTVVAYAKGKPSGGDIAAKAKGAKLDKARGVNAKSKKGKTVKFTPVATAKAKMSAQEGGHYIGTIDSQFVVSTAKLQPGTYNLYGAKVDGNWTVFFESGGKVVGESKMTVSKRGKKADKASLKHKPSKKAKGPKGPKKTDLGGVELVPVQEAWEEFSDEGWYDIDGAYCWEDWDTGDVWCDDLWGLVCNQETGGCEEYEW